MAKTKKKPQKPTDAFEAVAKRLGCDPDMKTFDAKLGKIAKVTPKRPSTSRKSEG